MDLDASLLLREFERHLPDPASVSLTTAQYFRRSGISPSPDPKPIGTDEWIISGEVNAAGLEELTTLGTRQGVQEFFEAAHQRTGDDALFALNPAGSLQVQLLAYKNRQFHADSPEREPGLPFLFKLTISRTEPEPAEASNFYIQLAR